MTLEAPGYTPLRELGSGASGTVVLARHEATGQLAAIKHLSPQMAADPAFLGQFREEARLLERLRHPNITALWEYIEQGGEAALVMEFVDGIPLRALLEERGTLDPVAALVVLKGSLLGLEAAHAAGVVHRDYKPENVLLTREAESKLVDFGVAVPAGNTVWKAGTPSYMAPEQWQAGTVSPQTDVYAATCVFFEALVGRRPFVAPDLPTLEALHCSAPIPAGEAPEPLRALIAQGMAKRALLRYPTAAAFLAALETAAVGAYGENWEEEGRRRLALALLGLLALFPLGVDGAGAAAAGGAVVADVVGGGAQGLRLAAIVAGILVVAIAGTIGGMAATRRGPFGSNDAVALVRKPTPFPLALATTTPTVATVETSSTTATPTATPAPTPTPTDTPAPTPSATASVTAHTSSKATTSSPTASTSATTTSSTPLSTATPTAPPPFSLSYTFAPEDGYSCLDDRADPNNPYDCRFVISIMYRNAQPGQTVIGWSIDASASRGCTPDLRSIRGTATLPATDGQLVISGTATMAAFTFQPVRTYSSAIADVTQGGTDYGTQSTNFGQDVASC